MIQEIIMFIVYLFFGIIFLILVMVACSRIKQKLVDLFGHELKNTDKNVRKAYAMKLTDENQLKDIILNDNDLDVQIAALGGIEDNDMLRQVAKCRSKSVSRLALRKIKN